MLKAIIKNVSEWKAVLDTISDLVENAMFICNPQGITLRVMDASNLGLLDISFPKSSFEEFVTKTSFFGLRVADFKKVMNMADNNDVIGLCMENSTVITVSITGSTKVENIRLVEKSEGITPIPRLEYESKISLEPHALNRILFNLQPISEYVTINSHTDNVQISGKRKTGNDLIDLDKENPDLISSGIDENSTLIYSQEHMAQIISSMGRTSKKLDMEYACKNPIHMTFVMPSTSKIECILVPRKQS